MADKIANWVKLIGLVGLSVLAFLSFGLTSYFVVRGYSGVLFWDQWSVYERLSGAKTPLDALVVGWEPHAGHRMVLPYLIYWFNGEVSSWSNAPLLFASVVLQMALIWMMVYLLRTTISNQQSAISNQQSLLLFSSMARKSRTSFGQCK